MENDLYTKLNVVLNAVLNEKLKDDIDDTLLEKLFSQLKDAKGPNGMLEDILQRSELVPLLLEKLSSNDWESVGQAFALQLVNILILHYATIDSDLNKVEGFSRMMTSAMPLIENALTSPRNPSVTVAAIECLISLYSGNAGWPIESRLLKLVCKSLTDKSYFVQKTAKRLIAQCLQKFSKQDSPVDNELERIILEPIFYEDTKVEQLLGTIDAILVALKDDTEVAHRLKRNPQMRNALLHLLEQNGTSAERACELLASLISTIPNVGKNEEINDVMQHLITCKKRVLILKFIYFCLRSEERISHESPHLNILYCPLAGNLLESMTIDNKLKKLLNETLLDKTLYLELLMNSLSLLCKLVPLLHSESQVTLIQMLGEVFPRHSNCRKTLTLLVQLQFKVLHSKDIKLENADIIKSLKTCQYVLTSSAVTTSIFNQMLQNILQLLHFWSSNSTDMWETPILTSFGETLNRKLVDRHWEIIDSALEFIANLLAIPHSEEWICNHKLHSAVWSIVCIPHCDGYVKASAIKALLEMYSRENTWKRLMVDENINMVGLFDILLQYVQDDTNVFVQRAAASAMQKLSENRNPNLYVGLRWCCSCSLDWELKLTALRTWEKITEQELDSTSPPGDIIQRLYEMGLLSSLVATLTDCEKTVILLSARITLRLRMHLQEKGFRPNLEDVSLPDGNNEQNRNDVTDIRSKPCIVMEQTRNAILDEVLNLDARKYLMDIMLPPEECNIPVPKVMDVSDSSCKKLLQHIWESNLLEIIEENAISADVYSRNFEFVINDILSSIQDGDVMETQITDCY